MSNIVTKAATHSLYQSNGSRIEAFFELDGFVRNLLKPMIDASSIYQQTKTAVVFDDGSAEVTDVIGLLFGKPELGFVSLFAANSGRRTNEILGIYPVASGVSLRVRIDEVIVWDNQICATIMCSINDYPFAFFATDFYNNKEKYIENEFLDIDLVAFACFAEEAERGFSFEGQKAIDWLAKMGEEPSYNEDGSVQPVNFSMEQLAAYLAAESKAPDEAQFQSPAGPVESMSFVNLDLLKTSIIIRGEEGDFSVPLILRKELIPALEEGMPIRGYSCMIGKIVE